MIVAALLLCAVGAQCAVSLENEDDVCVSTDEVACFVAADYVNAYGPVDIKVNVGQKLLISLQGLKGHTICYWMKENEPTTSRNGSVSFVLAPLLVADSGNYQLTCAGRTGLNYSQSVSLHVTKRPTKPLLTLTPAAHKHEVHNLICQSVGSPKPSLKWINLPSGSESGTKASDAGTAVIQTESSDLFNKLVMCCATNPEGQECSQVYDYDLDVARTNDEFSNVTLSPGDSLLLRCKVKYEEDVALVWNKDMKAISSECSTPIPQESCIIEDSYYDLTIFYLMVQSVRLEDSGTYTCSRKDKSKSVHIQVSDIDFLSVQLEDSIILPKSKSDNHLQANISYHPVLQSCVWEGPDRVRAPCLYDKEVTQHRRVWMNGILQTGDYKLHMKAGTVKQTKTVSVCIVDDPKFKLDQLFNNFTIETSSATPANYSWFYCTSSNSSCETNSVWTKISESSEMVSEVHCNKLIMSTLSRDLLMGPYLMFCLTNSVSTWCSVQYSISYPSMAIKGPLVGEDATFQALKVGSLILIMALILVSIALTYFIKKKKPQYQPQLQMIQMVGPNDNDYIYINFKDFEYEPKWEFPRENLELGKELGAGAFGKVLQATAHGINKAGVSQQVAVKMLKEKHQTVEKEALMSELKMLTHIGHHGNIVNLLGACTTSGPIYLIFQYCRHGDMLNYLKVHSEQYHKTSTSGLNRDRFSNLYNNLLLKKSSSEKNVTDDYMMMHSATTKGQESHALLAPDEPGDAELFENPDDGTDDQQALTYDDLLSFAFQVAKGMEFLSSKNCIHRDLAARNVLVTNGRRVKIGDFGLARDIDNDSNYVVRGNVRLPVKWMAPESIFQGMYTMKSDIWAYGILLWEIFSLGVTPYPGMKVDHTFYSLIENGFKMECPYYAEEAVYGVMCRCWALDPCDRPSFSKVVSFMWDLLTEREEKLYHNLPDQTTSEYQNVSTSGSISALAKQNEGSSQKTNDYCQTQPTERRRAEAEVKEMEGSE
ncbi:receptor-type tyrosine-protein kinase FLT3-like [Neosynchiropus ocellatus]